MASLRHGHLVWPMSRLSISCPTGQTSKGLLDVVILRAAKVEIANRVASISAASVVYPRFWTPSSHWVLFFDFYFDPS